MAICAAGEGQAAGLHHVSFEMPDEASLDEADAALDVAGINVVFRADSTAKRSLFLRDPDGLLLEFGIIREPDYAALGGAPAAERVFLA